MAKKKVKHVPGFGIFALLIIAAPITIAYEIPPLQTLAIILILFVIFAVICLLKFSTLSKQYLDKTSCRRVMDIKNCLTASDEICGEVLMLTIFTLSTLHVEAYEFRIVFVTIFLIFFIFGVISAQHLAVVYLGVVVDEKRNFVALPYDMESYTITDYITLQFIRDYCNIDTVPLSEISRLSRGKGVELYMHGDFGSRGLLFSSKQKRDEALAMIKELNANATKLLPDIEGY